MEKKSIIQWLYAAKEMGFDWADSAISQCNPNSANNIERLLSEALLAAFDWGESIEHYSYWSSKFQFLKSKGL